MSVKHMSFSEVLQEQYDAQATMARALTYSYVTSAPVPPRHQNTRVLCVGVGKAFDVPEPVLDWVYSFQTRLTRQLFAEAMHDELWPRTLDYKQSRQVPMAIAREEVLTIAMGLAKHKALRDECERRARVLYGCLFDTDVVPAAPKVPPPF